MITPSNPQSDYEKNRKKVLESQQKTANERQKQKEQNDKNAKIAGLNTRIAQNNKAIDDLNKQIKATQHELTPLYPVYNLAVSNALADGVVTSIEQQAIDYAYAPIKARETTIKNAKSNIDSIKKTNDQLKNQLNNLQNPKPLWFPSSSLWFPSSNGNTTSGSSNPPPNKEGKLKTPYQYNLPMMSSAYYNPTGPVGIALDVEQTGGSVNAGNFNDARQAWLGVRPGRGVIQMSKDWSTAVLNSKEAMKDYKNYDNQAYGFKFLYNPKEINMAWQISTALNPEYQASGKDEFIALAPSQSSISFEVILNRIEDMSILDALGVVSTVQSPYGKGITVEPNEARQIYEKGTMYDMEYFFKTINGPHATFVSDLNGTTADKGYLRPSMVELHLGASLRYIVRVQAFSIRHSIFNSRMVPILSTVRFDCGRFFDVPKPKNQIGGFMPATRGPAGGSGGPRRASSFL